MTAQPPKHGPVPPRTLDARSDPEWVQWGREWRREWNPRSWSPEDIGPVLPVGYADGRPLDEQWEHAASAELAWRVRMPLPDGGGRWLPLPKRAAGGRKPRATSPTVAARREPTLRKYHALIAAKPLMTREQAAQLHLNVHVRTLQRYLDDESG